MKFSEALQPAHVFLRQSFGNATTARNQLLTVLASDPRCTNRELFVQSVVQRDAEPIFSGQHGLWICHGRTDAVGALLLGAASYQPGLSAAGWEAPVDLLVVAGIPAAFNHQYLQLVGALVRIFRTPECLDQLLAATTPGDFIGTLEESRNLL